MRQQFALGPLWLAAVSAPGCLPSGASLESEGRRAGAQGPRTDLISLRAPLLSSGLSDLSDLSDLSSLYGAHAG